MAEIVAMRQSPPLTDIPGQLRQLADEVALGSHGEVSGCFVVIPRDGDFPVVFGWGDVEGENHPVIQLSLAKHWLLDVVTRRAS